METPQGCCGDDGISPSGVVPTQDVLSMLSGIRRSLEEVSVQGLDQVALQHPLPFLTLKSAGRTHSYSRTGCLRAPGIPRHKECVWRPTWQKDCRPRAVVGEWPWKGDLARWCLKNHEEPGRGETRQVLPLPMPLQDNLRGSWGMSGTGKQPSVVRGGLTKCGLLAPAGLQNTYISWSSRYLKTQDDPHPCLCPCLLSLIHYPLKGLCRV